LTTSSNLLNVKVKGRTAFFVLCVHDTAWTS